MSRMRTFLLVMLLGLICALPDVRAEGRALSKVEKEELNSELIKAAQNGQLAVAERVIAQGANVNTVDYCAQTPLHWAVSKGHLDLVG